MLRTFCLAEPLWRALYLDELPDGAQLVFDRSWRRSHLRFAAAGGAGRAARGARRPRSSRRAFVPGRAPRRCRCAGLAAPTDRARDGASLSVAEFERRFEAPVPVILTGLVDRWPAAKLWSEASLRARFGAQCFHVGGHECRLDGFFDYCASTADEQPLYLFDKAFADKAPPLAAEYEVLPFFAPERDLFDAMSAGARPDHRWLIIGGTRSGSLWHVDPNATRRDGLSGVEAPDACCWRAGRRPACCPPTTWRPSRSRSRSTSGSAPSTALAERRRTAPLALRPVEATVRAGELIFVPRGWWHAALNLEPATVAITQNCAAAAARTVLDYLRRPDLVSGVPADVRPAMHAHLPRCSAAAARRRSPTRAAAATTPTSRAAARRSASSSAAAPSPSALLS